MISVKIKKGCDLRIKGKPSLESEKLENPKYIAVLPEKIPYIKPRLLADTGDKVKIGSVLFEDKRNPHIKFLSPGGGEITQIKFGPRRVIEEIVIRTDDHEGYAEFDRLPEKEIEHIHREKLVNMLLKAGMWHLIKALPFRDIANPDTVPPAVFVSLGAEEPFQPDPQIYLDGKQDIFTYGINVLRKLSPNVHIIVPGRLRHFFLTTLNGNVTHAYTGTYPADDPGVLLYHIKKSPSENRSWFVNAQDVLLLAHVLKTGKYPVERTMVIAGSSAVKRTHIRTRIGVPLAHLTQNMDAANSDTRYVAGGLFRGYTASKENYMGIYETSLTLLPEGKEKEAFGFVRPGVNKPTHSRAFLSVLGKSPMNMNCSIHGDERACVNCGTCASVCPVDILPQFMFKCILADELEESLEHGMLDCAECGLCTYVCPSKIEICTIIKAAKAAYYKEQGEMN